MSTDDQRSAVAGRPILVVDDDPAIRRLVDDVLNDAGALVAQAADGVEALELLVLRQPALVVLDAVMPRLDGWGTLVRLRAMSDVPVLMLTGRSGELEAVRGLRAGADEYVTKPFAVGEFLARCERLLLRLPAAGPVREVDEDAAVRVRHADASVEVRGAPVALTPLELRLLVAFLRNPGRVIGSAELFALAWSPHEEPRPEQVRLYVGYLRGKLAAAGVEPIETVRGFGYRYEAPG